MRRKVSHVVFPPWKGRGGGVGGQEEGELLNFTAPPTQPALLFTFKASEITERWRKRGTGMLTNTKNTPMTCLHLGFVHTELFYDVTLPKCKLWVSK